MTTRCCLLTCLALLLAAAALSEPARAATVLTLDASDLSLEQRQLAASLQGLANRDPEGPKVFVLSGAWDAAWRDYALRFLPQATVQEVSLPELFEALRPQVKGQVLYDPAQPYALAVATTAAGLRDAVLTPRDLGLTTVYDLRNRWAAEGEAYAWAAAELLPKAGRRQLAALPADSSAWRDYVMQQRMFTLSSPAESSPDQLRDLLARFSTGALVFGEEASTLAPLLSEFGFALVPAAEASNLSFYSTLGQGQRFFQHPGHLEPTAPRYLTLILDCSDLGFALQRMADLWEEPARSSTPLGWALPAAVGAAAPPIVHRYYADAYRSGTDQFVLGASGAGELTLTQAEAPEAFYQATAQAADLFDAHTALFSPPLAAELLGPAVIRFAEEGHLRGVFALTGYDQPPALYGGIPTLATPRVDSVEQAVTYLNRIPLERRFAAICLNARTLGPADAAHIAAHVASRYVVVPPAELMTLLLAAALPAGAGDPAIMVTSAEHPEGVVSPTETVPINAEIVPPGQVFAASAVYRAAGSRFAFNQPMALDGGLWRSELPPLRWGGPVEMKIRAMDREGRVAWSPLWTLQVGRQDADDDGVSDAEEAFLLTDPQLPDTDGDGMTDLNDPRPLDCERNQSQYFGPLRPPSDVPYLTDPAGSEALAAGRRLSPGQSASYWLPATRLPSDGQAAVRLEGEGPAIVFLGSEPGALVKQFSGEISWRWHSKALAAADYPSNVYLRIACPQDAASSLTLYSLGLVSPPDAPSITQVHRTPANPGPEQPITVSALIYSPEGVAEARLLYRVNGRGQVGLPMSVQGQRYYTTLPALANLDQLEYWISARDAAGNGHATPITSLWIGGRGREIVAVLARRDFVGDWRPSPEWAETAAFAPFAGAEETAKVNLTGGTYTLWALAGGRGNGMAVSLDGKLVGRVEPDRPDGWQQVGRARVEAGRHLVSLTASAISSGETWSAPRYSAVVLSTDSTFTPPPDQVLDVINSLVLLSPDISEPLSGTVELQATGAGNLLGMELSLDGTRLRRVSGPPFHFSLGTERYDNGPHLLRLEAVDRTGPTGLALEIPVTFANP